jgi:hypothetical protein
MRVSRVEGVEGLALMVRQTSSPLISGKLTSSRSSCGFISPIRRRLSAPVGSFHHSITGAAQDPALGIAAGVIDVENDKGQRFSHEGTCTQIGQLCCSPPFQPSPQDSAFKPDVPAGVPAASPRQPNHRLLSPRGQPCSSPRTLVLRVLDAVAH